MSPAAVVREIEMPLDKEGRYADGFGFIVLSAAVATFIIWNYVHYGIEPFDLTSILFAALFLIASIFGVLSGIVMIVNEVLLRHRNSQVVTNYVLATQQMRHEFEGRVRLLQALAKLTKEVEAVKGLQYDVVDLLLEVQDQSLPEVIDLLRQRQAQPEPKRPTGVMRRLRFLATGR